MGSNILPVKEQENRLLGTDDLVGVQDCRKIKSPTITEELIYGIYLKSSFKNRKIQTCQWLDFETAMPRNLPGHCSKLDKMEFMILFLNPSKMLF